MLLKAITRPVLVHVKTYCDQFPRKDSISKWPAITYLVSDKAKCLRYYIYGCLYYILSPLSMLLEGNLDDVAASLQTQAS